MSDERELRYWTSLRLALAGVGLGMAVSSFISPNGTDVRDAGAYVPDRQVYVDGKELERDERDEERER
jgi:hypothetical protein